MIIPRHTAMATLSVLAVNDRLERNVIDRLASILLRLAHKGGSSRIALQCCSEVQDKSCLCSEPSCQSYVTTEQVLPTKQRTVRSSDERCINELVLHRTKVLSMSSRVLSTQTRMSEHHNQTISGRMTQCNHVNLARYNTHGL